MARGRPPTAISWSQYRFRRGSGLRHRGHLALLAGCVHTWSNSTRTNGSARTISSQSLSVTRASWASLVRVSTSLVMALNYMWNLP